MHHSAICGNLNASDSHFFDQDVLKNRRFVSLLGKHLSPDESVAGDTTDAFFFSMLIFLLLILSVGVLRVVCPRDTLKTEFTWSLVLVFVYPLGLPLFFAFVQWYFQVPKMAKQKLEFYSFKALIAEIGSKLPEDQDLKATLEHWEWTFSPVCLLDRDQCLTLLNHCFASLEDSEEAGGIDLLGGKAMNIVSETIDNNAALLSNTVTTATNVAIEESACEDDSSSEESHVQVTYPPTSSLSLDPAAAVAKGDGAVHRPSQLSAPELLQVRQMSPE
jgi:hypothetical protein